MNVEAVTPSSSSGIDAGTTDSNSTLHNICNGGKNSISSSDSSDGRLVGTACGLHTTQESDISLACTSTSGRVTALKEESSDESTIISSQTSTLTRNQGNKRLFFTLYILKSGE